MYLHRKRTEPLPFKLTVENVDWDYYQHLKSWVRSNIPTTDSATPNYQDPDMFEDPMPLTFRFRTEEQLMAFKLILY